MKKCNNCFEMKPETEFYRIRKGYDELQKHCKPCHAEIVRGYARQKRARLMSERWQKLRQS